MSDHSNVGPFADPSGTESGRRVSRRAVLRGAGAGAAGLAAAAAAGTPALAAAAASGRPAGRTATARGGGPAEPVVVHLRDAGSGEMDVFAGTGHTRLRDPDLAARLVRAVR